jgi:hypothetical protein
MAKQMTSSNPTPTHEQIARRAYEIFIERGQPEGHDLDHWLEAEAQLCASGRIGREAQPQSGARASQGNGRTQSRARK